MQDLLVLKTCKLKLGEIIRAAHTQGLDQHSLPLRFRQISVRQLQEIQVFS